MDYFRDAIHLVYLAKQLHDAGKTQAIEYLLDYVIAEDGEIDFDVCNEAAFSALEGVYEYSQASCYENKGIDVTVLSDEVVVEFYKLAGEYGKRSGFNNSNNPYIIAAEKEAERNFSFSYSLSWRLQFHTEAKRPFHSRLAIIIYHDDYVDMLGVAIGAVSMYQFFSENRDELRELLSKKEAAAA